jgi:hypothetical protein
MRNNEEDEEISLVDTLTALAQSLQPPLETNEWLEPDGSTLTSRGQSMCVELAWDAFAVLVPHASGTNEIFRLVPPFAKRSKCHHSESI